MTYTELLEIQELNPEYILIQNGNWIQANLSNFIKATKERLLKEEQSSRVFHYMKAYKEWQDKVKEIKVNIDRIRSDLDSFMQLSHSDNPVLQPKEWNIVFNEMVGELELWESLYIRTVQNMPIKQKEDVTESDIKEKFVVSSFIAVCIDTVYLYTDNCGNLNIKEIPRQLFITSF